MQTPAGCGSVVGGHKKHISLWKGEGGKTHKLGWKELSSAVFFTFNCFCTFSLTLCAELEVWHFKVSFYRNKCQERWVILISLKINPGCQRNKNFALKLSQWEARFFLPVGWAAARGSPKTWGQYGAGQAENKKQKELGIWVLFKWKWPSGNALYWEGEK